jgi:hypothetical protein
MEINFLTVNDLTTEHSRKFEGRKGIQKFENRVLRKVFGSKKDEDTGEW